MFHRVAQAMERAHAGITAPGKHQLRGAAGTDQLVVNEIRRHPNEREIATALADHFVTRGKRDQMGKALHGDGIAVVNGVFDGGLE